MLDVDEETALHRVAGARGSRPRELPASGEDLRRVLEQVQEGAHPLGGDGAVDGREGADSGG